MRQPNVLGSLNWFDGLWVEIRHSWWRACLQRRAEESAERIGSDLIILAVRWASASIWAPLVVSRVLLQDFERPPPSTEAQPCHAGDSPRGGCVHAAGNARSLIKCNHWSLRR